MKQLLILFLFAPWALEAKTIEPAGFIPVWERVGGDHKHKNVTKKGGYKKVALADFKFKNISLLDSQYGQKRSYLAISLKKILAGRKMGKAVDTALLHFQNGMLIPVSIAKIMENPSKIHLAIAIKNASGVFSKTFPRLRKPNKLVRDPRPLRFKDHKLVVSDSAIFLKKTVKINPFRYADSLKAIELINENAYLHQFAVPGAKKGHAAFANRCQFCHGARDIGASYGWDFVLPLPLYKKRDINSLMYHIKYIKQDALAMGLMMPQQKDVSKKEVAHIWEFLKASAKHQQNPYKP